MRVSSYFFFFNIGKIQNLGWAIGWAMAQPRFCIQPERSDYLVERSDQRMERSGLERSGHGTKVVYHLFGKTGWSTVVVNGTRQ